MIVERPKIKTYRPGDVYRYAHLKRDGIWLTLHRDAYGLSHAWTRHPTEVTDQLRGHRVFEQFVHRAHHDCTLFCELYALGQPASMVKSYLADGRTALLDIECFASPDLAEDASLDTLDEYAFGMVVDTCEWLNTSTGHDDVYETMMAWSDAEGVVYKDGNLLNWAKRKPVLTTDLVVHGFVPGKGRFLCMTGALECGLYDGTPVARVSGMDDATRGAISDDEDSYLGCVVEVAYQYVGSGGRLRHPRFIRFREDKKPEECTEI